MRSRRPGMCRISTATAGSRSSAVRGSDKLDLYNNSLVTGFRVKADGTYELTGDENLDTNRQRDPGLQGAGSRPRQLLRVRGRRRAERLLEQRARMCITNADCQSSICGIRDGTTMFDPALWGQEMELNAAGVNYADPADCTGRRFLRSNLLLS